MNTQTRKCDRTIFTFSLWKRWIGASSLLENPHERFIREKTNFAKIFVINANNWHNKGDVSNRVGLVTALRESFGVNISICIDTRTPDEDSEYFRERGVEIVESIYHVDKANGSGPFTFIHKFLAVFSLLFCYFMYRCFGYVSNIDSKSYRYFKKLVDSDIIISSAGGFLQDYHILNCWFPNSLLVFLAESLRKPVVIYAQSVGPFRNRIVRFISKVILERADLITLRENISKDYLAEAHIHNPQTYVTADSTFSFPVPSMERDECRRNLLSNFHPENSTNDVIVGLSIVGEYFNHKKVACLSNYVSRMASLIDHLSIELGAKVVIVPQVFSETELVVMQLVKSKITRKSQVLLIHNDLTPEDLMRLIGSFDLMIGNRMHSCIFALLMKVPVVAIAYEHKALGIMHMLNLERWVVDITDSGEKLSHVADELFCERTNIVDVLQRELPKLQLRSVSNGSLVYSLYKNLSRVG